MYNVHMKKKYTAEISLVVGSLALAAVIFVVGLFYMDGVSSDVLKLERGDHVYGDRDASITIVEFSDYQCPYCHDLHPTLKRIVDERDDVNWVYRHFPLSIHSEAEPSSIAAECVADLGDNDDFWAYSEALFENQYMLSDALYLSEAKELGIDEDDFNDCLLESKIADRVKEDLEQAYSQGGRGTPFSVIVNKEGESTSFSGALSYDEIVSVIEGL